MAARLVFESDGISAPLRLVAEASGVAPATLYRHFATKRDLADAVFAAEMDACRAVVQDTSHDPDPWRGLCRFIEEICELHVANRAFTTAFLAQFPDAADLAAERTELFGRIGDLARRARAEGSLRRDFRVGDLILMLQAHRGVTGATPAEQRAASRRFAALTIDALSAPPDASAAR